MGLNKDELAAAIAVVDTAFSGIVDIHSVNVRSRELALDREHKLREDAKTEERWQKEFDLKVASDKFAEEKFQYQQYKDSEDQENFEAELALRQNEQKEKRINRQNDLVASYGADNVIWKIPGKNL